MEQWSVVPTTKRKTIDDFFSRTVKEEAKKVRLTNREQVITPRTSIPGLRLISDFVTREEELDLLTFLDRQSWRSDLQRRVIHYGGTYCLMPPRTATATERKAVESTPITAEPIPNVLEYLLERMVRLGLYKELDKPEYCIVNEYKENQGISAHVENFKFISPVCGLTLGNGDWMRFHELSVPDDGSVRSGRAAKAKRTGRRTDTWMPPRSLLVMSGDAREKWQHEIVRSRKGRTSDQWRRVSLTFRSERRRELNLHYPTGLTI